MHTGNAHEMVLCGLGSMVNLEVFVTAEIIPIRKPDHLRRANGLLNEALDILHTSDPELFWKVADARNLLLEYIRMTENTSGETDILPAK